MSGSRNKHVHLNNEKDTNVQFIATLSL